MTHEPLERDPSLESALRGIVADPEQVPVDWAGLRRRIARQASPELTRRRARPRWMHVTVPAALAASIALLVVMSRGPEQMVGDAGVERVTTATTEPATVDELLDADVSDRQFRALLFGANEAEELLMIAAEEEPSSVR